MKFNIIAHSAKLETPARIYLFNHDLQLMVGKDGKDYLDAQGLLIAANVKGKTGEIVQSYSEAGKHWTILCGVDLSAEDPAEELRRAGAAVIRVVSKRYRHASIFLPPKHLKSGFLAAVVEGLSLSASGSRPLKTKSEEQSQLEEISLVLQGADSTKEFASVVRMADAACRGTRWARELADTPANLLTPEMLAEQAREMAAKLKLDCSVFGVEKLDEMGMNGILRVGAGSINAPCLITIDSKPKSKEAPICLVGKGITFDSGGISIKPSKDMHKMRADMAGAAAVLATARVLAEIGFKRRFMAVIPAAENMTGSNAQRPGDVITMADGTTVEVLNTDAEGRLVLADALAWLHSEYKPVAMIDLATLTGAVTIALGKHAMGLMSNSEPLSKAIFAAGQKTYERAWPLPMFSEYRKQLESSIADLQNIGGREAGTITAGMFLRHFAGDTPWAHLDIAGVSWNNSARHYLPKGPSGAGVRLLVELLTSCWPEGLSAPIKK